MMWVDYYFRPQYVYNSAVMGNARLNCTVMVVLHVPNLRSASAPPAFSSWPTVMKWMVNALVLHWDWRLGMVEGLNAARRAGLVQGQVPVPLDVHHTCVRSLYCLPYYSTASAWR